MSLFERLNNKRYNLREVVVKPGTEYGDFGDGDTADDIKNKKKSRKNKFPKSDLGKNPDKYTVKVGRTIVDTEIVPKKSLKPVTKSGSKSKGSTPVKVNVTKPQKSQSATKITKKYNELNKNRPEFNSSLSPSQRNLKNIQQNKGKIGKLVVKPSISQKAKGLTPGDIDFKDAESLYKKRTARISSTTGKATKAGVVDFASSLQGANRSGQTHLNKKQIAKIKRDAKNIANDPFLSKPYKDKINKSDYAGKRIRQRPSNAPSYAEIKKQIDAKNPTFKGKSGGRLPVLGGKDSLTRKSGKLKSSKTVDRILGQTPEKGQGFGWKDIRGKGPNAISKTYKPPKGRFGKLLKYIGPKGRKIAGGVAILGGAYAFRKQLTPNFLKKKEKYKPITPVPLKLNLSSKTKNLMVDPKNPTKLVDGKKVPNKVSRQSLAVRDRNIYTGKLLPKSSSAPKPKGLSSSDAKKISGNTFRSKK